MKTYTLRQARDRSGMTQAELSKASGVHLSTITQLERGIITDPRTNTARALAEALGIDPWLLTFGGRAS